jgi:tetratricopeptide (TPR) repeat protein
MNKHYKLTQKAISVAISLLTANFVFGIVPLNILPTLSQPVFAQKNSEKLLEQGVKKLQQEDYLGALETFTEAIRLDSNNADIYYLRGITCSQLKSYQRAIEDYKQATRLNPNFTEAYFKQGVAYSNLENLEKALESYNQVIRLNPDFITAYANRGSIYKQLGNFQKAKADFQKVISFMEQNKNDTNISAPKEFFTMMLDENSTTTLIIDF